MLVGLFREYGYRPCMKVSGNKKAVVVLTESEVRESPNYLYSNDEAELIDCGEVSISLFVRVINIWGQIIHMFIWVMNQCASFGM